MATVLIIDDSHLGRTHAGLALEGTPHRVVIARDGVEALELLESEQPDCVVLNQHTPALSTDEIIDHIRTSSGHAHVIVRGTALTEQTESAYRTRGADAVLSSPRDGTAALLRAIEACLGREPYSRAG